MEDTSVARNMNLNGMSLNPFAGSSRLKLLLRADLSECPSPPPKKTFNHLIDTLKSKNLTNPSIGCKHIDLGLATPVSFPLLSKMTL